MPSDRLRGLGSQASTRAVFMRESSQWPQALVPDQGMQRLRSAAGSLPQFSTGLFLEAHLSEPERTDIAARLYPQDRDALLEHGVGDAAFQRFLATWGDSSDLANTLPAADVEVDVVDGSGHPFVCPSFGRLLLSGNEPFRGPAATELALHLTRVLWPEIPEELVANTLRLQRRVPAPGILIPGWPLVFRSEGPGPRLRALLNVPRLSAAAVLRDFGWTGDVSRFTEVTDVLGRARPWVSLDLDVTAEGVTDRVGIGYDALWVRAGDASLQTILNDLQGTGWCREDRLRGLREWVSARHPEQDGQWRALTLKVVLTAGAPPKPKAYLSTFDVAT